MLDFYCMLSYILCRVYIVLFIELRKGVQSRSRQCENKHNHRKPYHA